MHLFASVTVVVLDPETAKRNPLVLQLTMISGAIEFALIWACFVVSLWQNVGKR